tara:strand:+ start:4115 stop:4615 length:501 start_codon:yes stop_codon:yes gene_type:complete
MLQVACVDDSAMSRLERAKTGAPMDLLATFLCLDTDEHHMQAQLGEAPEIVCALKDAVHRMTDASPLLQGDMSMLPQLSPQLSVRLAMVGMDTPRALLALAMQANLDENEVFQQLHTMLFLCCTETLHGADEDLCAVDPEEVRRVADIVVQEARLAWQALFPTWLY